MSRNHSRNIHTWVNSSCYICVQKQLYIIQTSYIYREDRYRGLLNKEADKILSHSPIDAISHWYISILSHCRNVSLPFQWMIYKPQFDSPGADSAARKYDRVPNMDSVFSVHPPTGVLPPCESMEFKMTYAPPVVRLIDGRTQHMVLVGNTNRQNSISLLKHSKNHYISLKLQKSISLFKIAKINISLQNCKNLYLSLKLQKIKYLSLKGKNQYVSIKMVFGALGLNSLSVWKI